MWVAPGGRIRQRGRAPCAPQKNWFNVEKCDRRQRHTLKWHILTVRDPEVWLGGPLHDVLNARYRTVRTVTPITPCSALSVCIGADIGKLSVNAGLERVSRVAY